MEMKNFAKNVMKIIFTKVLQNYKTCLKSKKNIDEELYLGHAISMITRRNLFKETLCQISNFNANRPIELRKLNKLISIHKRQIMRLEMKSQSRLENYKFLTHIQRTLGSVQSF